MSAFEKAWFVLSLMVLSFGYGYACHSWGWFPQSYVEQAWLQAREWVDEDIETKPRVYERSGARTVRPDQVQPGLTLVTSYWPSDRSSVPQPGARLLDRNGRVLHEWMPDRAALFSDVNRKGGAPTKADFDGSYLFPNGDLLLVLDYIGAVRVDACGEVVWRLAEGNHHYFSRAEDGSFWMPGTSAERRTQTAQYPDGFPGIDTPVWLDQILRVGADGTVHRRINVLDVLYQNDLERHIVKAFGAYARTVDPDVVHLNDVEPLPDSMAADYPLFEAGDLVVSLRRPSLVFVFDPDTGTVRWHASHPFLRQHDPDFLGDGWIGVFDNNYDFTERGTMLGGSRIVAIQPHTDSVEVRFPTAQSEPFYTRVQGQWQQLANGNMLLVERGAGRVAEVNPDGETVWDWVHAPYDETRVPIVTGAHRYDLSRETVAAWPCSPSGSQTPE
jgi:hypothetical protein